MQWLLHPPENSIFDSALKAPGFGPGDIHRAPTMSQIRGSHEELNTRTYSSRKRAGIGAKWQVQAAQMVGWGGGWGALEHCRQGDVAGPEQRGPGGQPCVLRELSPCANRKPRATPPRMAELGLKLGGPAPLSGPLTAHDGSPDQFFTS